MTYVWAAYTLIWIFIFGYSLFLGRRQNQIEKELDVLKAALAEKNS